MDQKYYTLIISLNKDGLPQIAHLLSGHLNSVYDREFPTIPITATSDQDAMDKANDIVRKQIEKIAEYIRNKP